LLTPTYPNLCKKIVMWWKHFNYVLCVTILTPTDPVRAPSDC